MTARSCPLRFSLAIPVLTVAGSGCHAPQPTDNAATSQAAPVVVPLDQCPALVRGSEWTEWYYLGKLGEHGDGGPDFWRLELEMSEPQKEQKMLGR